MSVEIKFCGLMRAEDAEYAATLGAAYVGVIFAGGRRMLTVGQASVVLAGVPRTVRRVGVFADQSADEIGRVAGQIGLDVVQLHGSSDGHRIAGIRREFGGSIWPVTRAVNGELPAGVGDLFAAGDGLVLDAFVDGSLGGNGVPLPWPAMAGAVRALRTQSDKPIILAGGLKPENVARAIADLAPDVVDVSSGVEREPGIKDHDRMRAFRDAVLHASILT